MGSQPEKPDHSETESKIIQKGMGYVVMVPDDQLIQITPKLWTMLRLDNLDLKDFILYLEMVTEIKSKFEGLSAYNNDAAAILLRKDKIQIILPEEAISIPLDMLFIEKDKEGAYRNHRLDVFRDLSAAGCFKTPESLLQNPETITLTRSSINEQNFYPLCDVIMKAYLSKAQEIRRLAGISEKNNNIFHSASADSSRVLTKDSNGDYFYDGKRIEVNTHTIYYDVFDILYSYRDQDNFLSYKEIEARLVERKHPRLEDMDMMVKRIQNAITSKKQGFFWYAKINGHKMTNKTLDGKKLVEGVRGGGIRLNNSNRSN